MTKMSLVLVGACSIALASTPGFAQTMCQNIGGRPVQVELVGGKYRPLLINGQMVDCDLNPGESLEPGMVGLVVGGLIIGGTVALAVAENSRQTNPPIFLPPPLPVSP